MNGDKKFKEIYNKFGGSYGDLILEHLRVLNELEKAEESIYFMVFSFTDFDIANKLIEKSKTIDVRAHFSLISAENVL